MKTKALLLLCLFMGIAVTRLSAQNGNDQTGSYSEYYTADGWTQGAYCNGVQVDFLTGSLSFHHTAHYLKGVWLWCKVNCVSGELTSTLTGEVFTVHEMGKQLNNIMPDGSWEWVDVCRFNLVGDKGSHYIGTIIWDWTGAETSVSAVCPGNDK